MKSGLAGKATLGVKAKGLPLYSSPYGTPQPTFVTSLRVQMPVEGGACFETTFSTPIANDPIQFEAKGD